MCLVLVARAVGCQKLGITSNLGAEDEVSAGGILARTFKLLHTPTGYQLPDPDSLTDWEDLTDSPGVCEKDIYNYLVLSHHRTTDNGEMGASRHRQCTKKGTYTVQNSILLLMAVTMGSSRLWWCHLYQARMPRKLQTTTPGYALASILATYIQCSVQQGKSS